jgi:threonine/homoserine/homoserine lactone efflux protein
VSESYAVLLFAGSVFVPAVAAPVSPTGTTAVRHDLIFGWWAAFRVTIHVCFTDFLYLFATYFGLTPLVARAPWLGPFYGLGVLMLGRVGPSTVRDDATDPRRLRKESPRG